MNEMGLEELINRDNRIKDRIPPKRNPKQTAEKSATLQDFYDMTGKIVTRTIEDTEYFPNDRSQRIKDQSEQIDNPYITYKTVKRVPHESLKPVPRDNIKEEALDENERRGGQIFGQKYSCTVQFNIFASSYETAEKIKTKFEDNMFRYTHYLKKNGVQEIFFEEELEDENYSVFRENISVRNLRYRVIIEHLFVDFYTEFESIDIK